jgi:hypothetical protein
MLLPQLSQADGPADEQMTRAVRKIVRLLFSKAVIVGLARHDANRATNEAGLNAFRAEPPLREEANKYNAWNQVPDSPGRPPAWDRCSGLLRCCLR